MGWIGGLAGGQNYSRWVKAGFSVSEGASVRTSLRHGPPAFPEFPKMNIFRAAPLLKFWEDFPWFLEVVPSKSTPGGTGATQAAGRGDHLKTLNLTSKWTSRYAPRTLSQMLYFLVAESGVTDFLSVSAPPPGLPVTS